MKRPREGGEIVPSERTEKWSDVEGASREQLELFAREFQRHYLEERRLLRLLADRNTELEKRVHELSALNRLFQRHLGKRLVEVEAHRNVIERLQNLATDVRTLVTSAQESTVPEMPDFSDQDKSQA